MLHNHKNAQAQAMNYTKAFEATKAVNRLLEFSGENQKSLLEVIQDYFMPDKRVDESSAGTAS